MSPRIHQLPEELIARIAAGEVVERPASVVKELVENSLDAGATRISLQIDGAGRTRLSFSDNGCGMNREEARLALKRHCTSKITALEDLEFIATFGFRGEALPSIASISRLTLTTRTADEDSGWQLVLEGGKVISEKPVAREPGTTIDVRDIFFNTPARFKFLKSDATERGQILRVLEEMAFCAPGVEFEFNSDGGKPQVFQRVEPDDLKLRIASAWGGRWGQSLVPVNASSPHFKLRGYVTHQDSHQATARYQFLFINRRAVQNRRVARAIYDAYTGQLPSLRHPGWVLFLDVDPATVDVNVHPSKREVKLTHESEIFGFVLTAVKAALSQSPDAHAPMFRGGEIRSIPTTPGIWSGKDLGSPQHVGSSRPSPSQTIVWEKPSFQPTLTPEAGEQTLVPVEVCESFCGKNVSEEARLLQDPSLRVAAQVKNTFIVAETDGEFLLIDQHAAAEKVAYEKILADLKSRAPNVQMLLVPYSWETALSVSPTVKASLTLLAQMGFVMEPFGKDTFVVKGVPAHLGDKYELASLLDGLCDVLGEADSPRAGMENNREHIIAAMAACKASVKAGDRLALPECEKILKDLASCEAPQTCPHGRPTMVRLPYDELLRRFRRS